MNVRMQFALLLIIACFAQARAETPANLRDEKLVAWCIVPFDGKNRGPAERAEMIARLGLKRVAYDWRQQHVPTFEEEIKQYKRHGIEYFAFWGAHDEAFKLFEKYDLHPQIWQTLTEGKGTTEAEKIESAAKTMEPLARRTAALGCKLGLYNHGGWGGEPQNLVAVCRRLRELGHDNVGIVYNLHHGHGHLDDFAEVLAAMKPYLLCLNLNGMNAGGDQRGEKILPLGAGEFDVKLLKAIAASGYHGPIGIIGHTQDDVELKLRDNLDGLHWILPQLEGDAAKDRPKFRTWPTAKPGDAQSRTAPEYSPQVVARLLEQAGRTGDAHRGLMVFSSAKSACISCHRIGKYGGTVGPELTAVVKQRKPEELVASVLWPKREVKPEFRAVMIVDGDGRTHQGYVVRRDDKQLVLRDPTKIKLGEHVDHQAHGEHPAHDDHDQHAEITLALNDIEVEREVGTLMPENLTAAMSDEQLTDLLRFVTTLGTEHAIPDDELNSLLAHAQAHLHGPATFPIDRAPLDPERWPSWRQYVNRDRLYDFYARQADYFRTQPSVPPLLAEYPGLDGGTLGHWGNQNDDTWADGSWNDTILSSVQCGIFRGGGVTVARGVCVQLGGELAVCFNPDTLTYDAVWKGGFVKFSARRKGFLGGLEPAGKLLPRPEGKRPTEPFFYHGFYRHGERVVFAYRIGETEYLDAPGVEDGRFTHIVAPVDEHPDRGLLKDAPAQWPQQMETAIEFGQGDGYVIDTIGLPLDNPWKALFFCGGHAFLPDGSALVCTMQGDVWHVSNITHPSQTAVWRRFAAGLHHALGIVVDGDVDHGGGVFVLGRDQITRLHDLNHDGEADYYECFSNAYETFLGHDFLCGLERDAAGNFYTASGPQGLLRISPDGRRAEVLATGFRNPDGVGLLPDGTLTVPCSEGDWTPASMICAVRPNKTLDTDEPPHFGYRGPQNGQPPKLPLVYLPRGVDNSAGGQVFVDDDRFGPLSHQLIHLSFGAGAAFLILRDEVDGQLQGAAVPIAGEFRSGVHRGRVNPADGQLYVTGMQGWGSYTIDNGCFQRVRYVEPTSVRSRSFPIAFHIHENGVSITFSSPLDTQTAADAKSHFAQCWNYRYGPNYGSPEFSTQHFGVRGHDVLSIRAAHVLADGKTLFLELPDLQPVNQLHLRVQSSPGDFHDLFATVHKLDKPFTDLPDYTPVHKAIAPHPILADLAMATRSVPNPYARPKQGARKVTITTGANLSYNTREFRVRAGELLSLTLKNPDVVPHNWALAAPGSLERVGNLANLLISDPEAALRHYVPDTGDILAYTDVVLPQSEFTIYFQAPSKPGRYPYLCTFPGHWKVMNGEMIVE